MKEPPAKAHLSARECRQAIRDRRGALFLLFCLAFIVAVVAVTAFMPRKCIRAAGEYSSRVLKELGSRSGPIAGDPLPTLSPPPPPPPPPGWSNPGFQTLGDTLKAQAQEVNRARNKMLELVQDLGIVDLESSSLPSYAGEPNQQMVLEKRLESADFRAQLSALEETEGEARLSRAAEMELMGPKMLAVYRQYLQNQRQAAHIERGELDGMDGNHPDLVALRSGMELQRAQLDAAVEQITENLKENISLNEELLVNAERITEEKEDRIQDHGIYSQYQQAKDEWGMAQQILNLMIQEQERLRLDTSQHNMAPATIHE